MMHALKVPQAFACLRIERQQRVCEEIVAHAIRSVKIEYGGAGGNVDDAAVFVQRHPSPVVRCTSALPAIWRPGGVAEFTWMRDGVKGPAQLAGAHIEGANVAGRSGIGFRV